MDAKLLNDHRRKKDSVLKFTTRYKIIFGLRRWELQSMIYLDSSLLAERIFPTGYYYPITGDPSYLWLNVRFSTINKEGLPK